MHIFKRVAALGLSMALSLSLVGCNKSGNQQVILYSNADEEAKNAMVKVLDENGYQNKYLFQSFGTSELGGKLLAEGTNLEADVVTMSSYYIESAQNEKNMFSDLTFAYTPMAEKSSFYAPIVALEGAIIINTEVLKENGLTMPTSLKDLAKPEYKGMLSVVDLMGSSTGWLMVQAIVSAYSEAEAKTILSGIYSNAGDHLETSGSGPIKKVRAGEVAIGFGLRHQAVADKEKGLPIDYVDPTEGNYSLQEGIAVVNKGDKTNALAAEIAQCIAQNVRPEMQKTYPVAIYEGEGVAQEQQSQYPKVYEDKLTVEILKEHQEFSESCK